LESHALPPAFFSRGECPIAGRRASRSDEGGFDQTKDDGASSQRQQCEPLQGTNRLASKSFEPLRRQAEVNVVRIDHGEPGVVAWQMRSALRSARKHRPMASGVHC
jgi:hypothetical protein